MNVDDGAEMDDTQKVTEAPGEVLDLPARDAKVRAEALAPVWAVVDGWESMAGESDRVGTIGGDAAARNFRRLADQLRTAIEGGSDE